MCPAVSGEFGSLRPGKTIYYGEHVFHSLCGSGFKANYYDESTGDHWWISGPHRDGDDRLYGGQRGVEIDADVVEVYWREIRGMESLAEQSRGENHAGKRPPYLEGGGFDRKRKR